MVSGRSKHQANIHTHRCNEVMLVWGSLRLAPIKHLSWKTTCIVNT